MRNLRKGFMFLFFVIAIDQVCSAPSSKSVYKTECDKHKKRCQRQTPVFPEDKDSVEGYVSMYRYNHTAQDLYANMDLTTPEAKALQKIEDMYFNPPAIDTIIEGKAYQARGYALGYPLVLITPNDTLIVVDAPESSATGNATLEAFRAIPAIGTKPIVAIIYTIFHADHIYGVEPFMKDQYSNEAEIKIYAHQNMIAEAERYDTFKNIKMPKTLRQYGSFVPEPWHINDLAANRLDISGPYQMLFPPTEMIHFPNGQSSVKKNIAGIDMEIVSIPGYTSDQIFIYIEDFDMVHGADAFYAAFPNLYTLRGELARNVMKWAEGSRSAASYEAAIMTFTHNPVLYGRENIKETLNNYADAIQYIHDQTIRFMSKGYPADVISHQVQLPKQLKDKDYLQEFYGMVDVSIKGVVDFYVGWFSGYVEDLFPVDRFERASLLVELVGESKMAVAAAKAYNQGKYEWSLELASTMLRYDSSNVMALDIRTECLKRIAEVNPSIIGRNYLLATIMEDWKLVTNKINANTSFLLIHLDGVFQQMSFHINASAAEGKTASLNVVLQHVDNSTSTYFLKVHNSILVYKLVDTPVPGPAVFITTELYFRMGLARYIPDAPMSALGTMLAGTTQNVDDFMALFDLDDEINGYIPSQQ